MTTLHKSDFGANGSSSTRINDSNGSQELEAGLYDETAPYAPRDESNVVDQEIALANLDPRTRTQDSVGPGKKHKKMGSSTIATVNKAPPPGNVPDHGIGISRDWSLNSE